MKLILLSIMITASALAVNAQSVNYGSTPGQEKDFNAKYTLNASIDDDSMLLKFSTDAPVTKAILSVYTPEQLAVRKGTDHTYPFTKPVHSYKFNLNSPAYKGFYAYWLKIYTADGLFQEYYFQKKKTPLTTPKKEKIEVVTISEEKKNAAGATVIITNIKCITGKTKVIAALKELDGVSDVKIDIKTGKLTIAYSSDGTPYTTILQTINENGFIANGQKPAKSVANPCASRID